MSDQGVMNAAPTVPELDAEIRRAAKVAVDQASTSQDPREVKELAQAVLAYAQSIVILDPSLVAPQGVPATALHPPKPQIPMDRTEGQSRASK